MTRNSHNEVTHHEVNLNVDKSPMNAYVARPKTKGTYPGVVLGFELFGITPYITATADKIASWGYVVIVPDFYHRTEQRVSLQVDDEGRRRGFELLNQLSRDHILADTQEAMTYLKNEGCQTIGMVGLSVGGHIAYVAAAELDLQAIAVCYAGWLPETSLPISQPTPTLDLTSKIAERDAHLLFIVGENDTLVPKEQQEQIQQALLMNSVRHDFIVYPDTTHGFLAEERPSYHQDSAKDAWSRIEIMLARELA
jgi:carboxymethylenebutenolidase